MYLLCKNNPLYMYNVQIADSSHLEFSLGDMDIIPFHIYPIIFRKLSIYYGSKDIFGKVGSQSTLIITPLVLFPILKNYRQMLL